MKHKIIFFFLFLSNIVNISIINGQGFGDTHVINSGWSFHLGDIKYGGSEFYDDSSWRKLDLPHDWSVEQQANPSLASCTGYLPGGIGWYRKMLEIPENEKGKNVYVYFEGVYNNSEVFINGKWIGKRPNGYVSFMYDLTPYINFGGRNVIAVRVDHSQDADSRWYTGSGIYRDVKLIFANKIHIDLWGVYYSAVLSRSNKTATLTLNTDIKNTSDKNSSVSILHEVYSPDGAKVSSKRYSRKLLAGEISTGNVNIEISNPVLWDLNSPSLDTIKTVLNVNGRTVDSSTVKAGLRSIRFDPDEGFFLNGKNMKVKGVCIHHDAGCLGAAVPKEVWKRRLMKLKEIGCNAIRMSHNPQATCVYELCDEIGLLVKDEAFDEWEYPKKKWISGWNKGTPGFQGSANYFREWCKKDLADMVRRDRNHPSVIMWSIGNEVDYPNDPYSHPVLNKEGISQHHVKGYLTQQPRAERLGEIAKELVAVVKQFDKSRPVTAALAGAVMSNETDYPGALDIVGYNYTEYRYKKDHETYPDRVFYGSETRHDINAWKAVRDNKFIFGQFIWTGFDYLGEAGKWPSRGFTTGMIDLTSNIKPGGYFRRALWYDSPVAYVGTYKLNNNNKSKVSAGAPHIWNYEDNDLVRVVTYTNCEETELYLNGKLVGTRKPYDDKTGIIYWDLPFASGVLEVKCYNKGELAASDKVETTGLPYKIEAKFDKKDGICLNEYLHLDIEIHDEKGRIVNLADNLVTCTVSGQAVLVGLESGESNAADNFRDSVQRCRNGRLLGYIKATDKHGIIRVRLSSPLLKSKLLEIEF